MEPAVTLEALGRCAPKPEATMNLLRHATLFVSLLAPMEASADSPTGISGTVLDAATKRPLPGIAVALERQDGSNESQTLRSNGGGFFVRLGLEPGRYAVTANVAGQTATCSYVDVFAAQMRRVDVVVSGGEAHLTCSFARFPASLVDPDESADVYRMH